MNMVKLEEIKRLIKISETIKNILPNYQRKAAEPRCDKHELCFSERNSFVISHLSFSLCGHYGYYGNSGCYTLASVPYVDANRLLVKILNKNMGPILRQMAEEAKKEATEMYEQANEEIAQAKKILVELKEETQQDLEY